MNFPRKISLILCLLAFISCADNLDFKQINDYNITPVITSSLSYFTVFPIHFFDSTATVFSSEITDESEIRIFDSGFVKDKLVKVDFNIEIKNEFDRDFTIEITLFNDSNSITHRFNDLKIKAKDLDFLNNQTVVVSSNSNIKDTTRIRITIKIDNSITPLDKADTSKFEFKSSAIIYIDTDA